MRGLIGAMLTVGLLAGCGGPEGEAEPWASQGGDIPTSVSPQSPETLTAELQTPLAVSLSSRSWRMVWRYPYGPREDPPVVVTASGGTPPYTYAWQRLSGDPSAYAVYPNSNSTTFNNYIPECDQSTYTSVWRCLVTDSTGAQAVTLDVSVSLQVVGWCGPEW